MYIYYVLLVDDHWRTSWLHIKCISHHSSMSLRKVTDHIIKKYSMFITSFYLNLPIPLTLWCIRTLITPNLVLTRLWASPHYHAQNTLRHRLVKLSVQNKFCHKSFQGVNLRSKLTIMLIFIPSIRIESRWSCPWLPSAGEKVCLWWPRPM